MQIRFDGWVLRIDSGELAKDGRRIRLQDQPLQILVELLNHPGELVTRERLIARLWPKGVVDFDMGLNSAVRRLRVALQDEADTPRYIETVPRKGYRFTGTIDPPLEPPSQAPALTASTELQEHDPMFRLPAMSSGDTSTPAAWYRRTHIYVAAGLAVLAVAGLAWVALRPVSPSTPPAETQSTFSGNPAIAVLPFRAAQDEASQSLAQSVTHLLRNRLALLRDLTVIADSSASSLTDPDLDSGEIGRKLNARFLLQGLVTRDGDRARMEITLVDASSGSPLWSTAFDRSVTDVGEIREEIAERIAAALHIASRSAASDVAVKVPINLDTYQLYMRGQRLMSNLKVSDAEEAAAIFSRLTVLDPGFARGYLGLGMALLQVADLKQQWTPEVVADAGKAFDRALELNPGLGEAWTGRARCTHDPVKAEELFRRGLQLAPSHGIGYLQFSDFLFSQRRRGEAIEMIDRALQIDPLSPPLLQRKAFLVMVARNDLAEHDRLLREALAINPDFLPALLQLANYRHFFSGEFAESIRLAEQAIALEPRSDGGRSLAAMMYLDVDDPAAALAVLRDSPQIAVVRAEIAQYQRDPRRAAEIARSAAQQWRRWSMHSLSPLAEAIRDDAIMTGDYASAVKLLESIHSQWTLPPMTRRGFVPVYAHTLLLAGEAQRGRDLATSLLVLIDAESVGRPTHWFSRERAALFATLGDDEQALQQLAAGQKLNHWVRWWYIAEVDPLYDRLRRDPRFQALAEQARKHRNQQRALLDEMRRKGEVPKR